MRNLAKMPNCITYMAKSQHQILQEIYQITDKFPNLKSTFKKSEQPSMPLVNN